LSLLLKDSEGKSRALKQGISNRRIAGTKVL
jgi:hypothetical protein